MKLFSMLIGIKNRFVKNKFPKGCKTGNEHIWMLKNVCPVCLEKPIEYLSNVKYLEKYPSNNVLTFGRVNIYLCDIHFKEFCKTIIEYCRGENAL